MTLSDALQTRGEPDFSLVIPCYNEESVVSGTLKRLLDEFSRSGYRLEVVAVDNGSSDKTGEIIRNWALKTSSVIHHRVDVNEGYGKGVLCGLPLATAPWVGWIPADGQVDAVDVVRLYEVAVSSNGWVIAKVRRRFRLDGLVRKIVSTCYNLSFRVLWPTIKSIDINGTPKIVPRKAVPMMGLKSKGWFLDPEVMIKGHALGMSVIEFNVFGRLRGAGVSHIKPGNCWEFFSDLLVYRFGGAWRRELTREPSAEGKSAPVGIKN
jgi:glycosyltransferase involved in cell wall biosynthesis